MSRSQTPHQVPFPGYQGPANGTPQFTHHPTPYQHLQQGTSASATQSPVIPDYDQHGRMQTASPSPFSPAGHVGPQISPTQSDHGSRVNTPQTFIPGQPFPQGMAPQFSPSPAMTSAAVPAAVQAQFNSVPAAFSPQAIAAQQQQRIFQQLQLQNQARQMAANNPGLAGRPGSGGMNPMANPQMAAMRAQHHQQPQHMVKPNSPEALIRTIQKFMMNRNLPFEPNPIVSGRPINLVQLYAAVTRQGGSKKVTASNMWPIIAQHLQFPPMHFPMAAQEIRNHYHQNLAAYELAVQQKQMAEQMQQSSPQRQPNEMSFQPSPAKPGIPGYDQAPQFVPSPQPVVTMQNNSQPNMTNGFMTQQIKAQAKQPLQHPSPHSHPLPHQHPTPHQPQPQSQSQPPQSSQLPQAHLQAHPHQQSQQSQSQQPPQQQQQQQPQHQQQHHLLHQHTQQQQRLLHHQQGSHQKSNLRSSSQSSISTAHDPVGQDTVSTQPGKAPATAPPGKLSASVEPPSDKSFQHIEDLFKPIVLPPSNLHGPVVVDEVFQLGEDIARLKPNVPTFAELGVIDIHALTMSIKSGIHAEMRMALDTLTTISCEPAIQLSLDNCDDLVETLVECAEDQVELLAENAAEVSDVMLLSSYEEVMRGCRLELTSLVDVPEFGNLDYELDRAVDRLICITTILRNFSFAETNFGILSMPCVVKFLSTVIQYLGTRNMLLRNHQNTLDFMKDALIYLSNLAHTIQLPGKEEALCLLHFLLAFAPSPLATIHSGRVMFTAYNPAIHKYTPAAIDSLAKLLARDEPNRMFYKAIFTGDNTSGTQHELLTRTFGLAICCIPDQPRKPFIIADARKVSLMQGLLAGDILAGLADCTLARLWLESADKFSHHLLRLSYILSSERTPPANQRQSHSARGQADADAHAYGSIINRGLTILRRLAEKSKQTDATSNLRVPSGVFLRKENLLYALLAPNIDAGVVRQLVTYAGLGT